MESINFERHQKIDIAKDPKTSYNELYELSNDQDVLVRAWVARSYLIDSKLAVKLSLDKDFYVRACLVQNPNCSLNILQYLLSDDASCVRTIAKSKLDEIFTRYLTQWKI